MPRNRRPTVASAPEPLLNVYDVAEWLNVTPECMWRWRRAGVGPPSVAVGRYVRYRRVDVETWLAAQTDVPQPAA